METTLSAIDASYYLWDVLWKREAPVHISCNILDVVQLTADGAVSGWIFTSSTGEVKSKLAVNWRLDCLANRCSYFEKGVVVHYYNVSNQKWMYLPSTDALAAVLGAKGASRTAVVMHPLLNRSSTFMEVVCVKPSNSNKRIEIPTYTNTWLCDLSAKGMKVKVDSLPTQSIICKDKESNSLSREYANNLIKLLETNMRIKVTHLSIVVIFESVPAGPSNTNNTNNNGILATETRIVRLHHISSLTYRTVIQPLSGGDSYSTFSDVNSNSVDTLHTTKPSRVDCCHGDFCLFQTEQDENAESIDDDDLTDFHIQSEALKAVNRHRPVTRNDPFRALAALAGEEEDHTAEKMDLYPGQTDHLIAVHKRATGDLQRSGSNASGVSFSFAADANAGGNIAPSDASLRSKQTLQSTLRTQKSRLLDEQVKRTEKKLKVMSKSIALARQEMGEIENRDIENMNSNNGNNRGDLSPNSKRRGKQPPKAVDPMVPADPPNAHTKIWPSSLVRWWLNTGRNLPKNSLSVSVPSSSAHCISKAVLGNKSMQELSHNLASSAEFAGAAVVNDADAPVEQANSMYFGWYYHPVRVCERCHKVYTELDRYRKMRFKHLMKQHEKGDDNDPKKWREVEARIFKQRQSVTRLAKLETASSAQHNAHQQQLYQQQQGMVAGSHSLAFDSVLDASVQGGVAFGRAYKNASQSAKELRTDNRSGAAVPVPSKALPPLPWGLSQQGASEAYYSKSNSILTNRILQRAPELTGVGAGAQRNVDDVVQQQWRELTSDRPGQQDSPPRNKAHKIGKKKAPQRKGQFNAERLLHPWQRDMLRMKEKLKNGVPLENDKDIDHHQNYEQGEFGTAIDGDDYEGNFVFNYGSEENDDVVDMGTYGEPPGRQVHSADYSSHGPTHSQYPDLHQGKPGRLQALSAGHAQDKHRRHKDKTPQLPEGRGGLLPTLQLNTYTGSASTTSSTSGAGKAPAPGPKTSLQQLKSIEASWADEVDDRPSTSSPKRVQQQVKSTATAGSPSSSIGSGLGSGNSAAVNRVSNALLGGLNLPPHSASGKAMARIGSTESIPEHHEQEQELDSRRGHHVQPAAHTSSSTNKPPIHPHKGSVGSGDGDSDGGEDDVSDSDEEIGWSPFAIRS